ncbi:transportin-3 [Cimex lectularius]|uniref:Transportin-3 n=1 Tax=Cimex lectularius TaxID=79782 RepID=A0A8I6S663_CIMLE|nr:transportin-3 [Cimex lectularius]
MDNPPSLETVYQAVYTLHNNPNSTEKEKASQWLGELQKSVYAWKISDEILHRNNELELCYVAAQTMRTKIQLCFHELPPQSHASLRNSLIEHIEKVNDSTNSAIVTQLCLALADLALQMNSWQSPVLDLIDKFSSTHPGPLLEILTVLPEEVGSRALRLGANRREEIHADFASCTLKVYEFLKSCLATSGDNILIQTKTLKCYTSWITAMPLMLDNVVVATAFHILGNNMSSPGVLEAATDCICALLQYLEENNNQQTFEVQLFNSVMALEQPFHMSVAHENHENCLNYCRVFTELAESFLEKIVRCSSPSSPHYAIKIFDLVLTCVGHYDYEVVAITFNLWYRLSEILYKKNNDDLSILFKPYIERLIEALCRHCQIDTDHEGLVEELDDFSDFRLKVSELIRDVVFIVGSSNCFRQMFISLQSPTSTWDTTEAALFIMQAFAKNILPMENDVVPKVVEAILNLPPNTHIAVRYTSLLLLGELCEWIEKHPQSLEPVLNMALISLQQPELASVAANCLQSICSSCREHMATRFTGLLQILQSLDKFAISNEAVVGLLKGAATVIEKIPLDQMRHAVKEICLIQIKPLCHLIENDVKPETGTKSDPAVWMDRLAAIFKHINPKLQNGQLHPCQPVITEIWPVLSSVCTKYARDTHIIEKSCRCLRYILRCVGRQSANILEPLVKQIVNLYSQYQHSSFLYLGSILVDEYASEPGYVQGLLDMLQAFIIPTFTLLQEVNGLKNHPDTVDDLFRLCGRFLQRAPVHFLTSPSLNSILQCALLGIALDHRDANASVMKFFYDLVHAGRNQDTSEDMALRKRLVSTVINEKGQDLITNLLHASIFYLHTYMLDDVIDVIVELMKLDRAAVCTWLEQAIKVMPTQNSGGNLSATPEQLQEFLKALLRAETNKEMTTVLRDFARLYR